MKIFASNCIQSLVICTIIVMGLAIVTSGCDTKWIRMVYMLSCGKKKRENGEEILPLYRRRLVSGHDNLVYGSNRTANSFGKALLRAIMGASENITLPTETPEPPVTVGFNRMPNVAFSGMRVNDVFLILNDLMEEDGTNELQRRDLTNLVEKCCKVPPVDICSAKDFIGACK